jgi:hypothetical protein
MELVLTASKGKGKRLKAQFYYEGQVYKQVDFGQYHGSTYIDHQDTRKKSAYLKRHRQTENWRDGYTAGALSRWILWNKPTLEESVIDFCARFGIVWYCIKTSAK